MKVGCVRVAVWAVSEGKAKVSSDTEVRTFGGFATQQPHLPMH